MAGRSRYEESPSSGGKGHGSAWRGIIFRNSYTALTDLVATSRKWFSRIFPQAKFNGSTHTWKFPDGEELLLRYARVSADYDAYHGWQCPFIFFDEITNWATPELYLKLMSINRCADKAVPRLYGATTNPSGVGARWVKGRFVDVCPPGQFFKDPTTNMTRVYLHSCLLENRALMDADPTYLDKLKSSTEDDENLHKAWILGEWDLSYGGFFADVWDETIHEIPNFQLPASWRIMRSFDWGSAKPWAVSYFAITNGEQPQPIDPDTGMEVQLPYFPANSTVVFDEIYGWNGEPDTGDRAGSQEIAERVLEKDHLIRHKYGITVEASCADTSIYAVSDGTSIGQNLASHGCHWTRAYKGAGSRISGWTLIRTMLGATKRRDLEKDQLYFCKKAFHHIRCLTEIQHDDKNPEDLDTNGEDHILDSLRYGLARRMSNMSRSAVAL